MQQQRALSQQLQGAWRNDVGVPRCSRLRSLQQGQRRQHQVQQRSKQHVVRPLAAISIDRKAHFELAWQRQQQLESLMDKDLSSYDPSEVIPVCDLPHLERLLGGPSAGSSVVVVGFHSRSCGVCKEAFRQYAAMAAQAGRQRAGARFLSHDLRTEFDDLSPVARMYGVRHVPAFLFFVDGALVEGATMPDSRQMAARGASRQRMQAVIVHRFRELQATLQGLLLKNAPSARR